MIKYMLNTNHTILISFEKKIIKYLILFIHVMLEIYLIY